MPAAGPIDEGDDPLAYATLRASAQRDHSAKRNHSTHRHFFSTTLDQFLFPDPNAVRSNRQG